MAGTHLQWLKEQMELWQRQGLADAETISRLETYYEKEYPKTQKTSLFSYVLVLLGTSLVLLGVILILARNWSDFPRLVRVFISLIPLLVGLGLGAYTIMGDKGGVWQGVSPLVIAAGCLTGLALNGQIYHVISAPSSLFFWSALLSLPLVYLFSSPISPLFYLAMTGTYLVISAASHTLNLVPYLLVGLVMMGLVKPHLLMAHQKGDFKSNSFWLPVFMVLVGLAFLLALMAFHVPVRTLLALYFASLLLLDHYLFGPFSINKRGLSSTLSSMALVGASGQKEVHTLDLLGKLGLYILVYVFSYRGFWRYTDAWELTSVHAVILALGFLALLMLVYILFNRKEAFSWLPLALPLVVLVFHLMADATWLPATAAVVFSLLFFAMGLQFLLDGINHNHLGLANQGLLFLLLIIATRFLDIDFSFLVRGVVFVLLGLGFLATNLWMVRKKGGLNREQ